MTTQLSCYIIDDEPLAIIELKTLIDSNPVLHLVGSATNPLEAFTYLQQNDVALLFVDINMGRMNGLELMKLLNNKVIWVTAHEKYALQSFNYENTVDYLVKPIASDRFQLAIKKALNAGWAPRTGQEPLEDATMGAFSLKTLWGKKDIPHHNIDYIKASGYCSTIFYGAEKAVVQIPLKDMEDLLPADLFTRVHKSYIINKKKVKGSRYNKVILLSNVSIPIGRTYRFTEE